MQSATSPCRATRDASGRLSRAASAAAAMSDSGSPFRTLRTVFSGTSPTQTSSPASVTAIGSRTTSSVPSRWIPNGYSLATSKKLSRVSSRPVSSATSSQ